MGGMEESTQRERNGKYKNEKERHEFIGCSEFITWTLSSFSIINLYKRICFGED